jgi:hypothetical protein
MRLSKAGKVLGRMKAARSPFALPYWALGIRLPLKLVYSNAMRLVNAVRDETAQLSV